MVSTRSSQGGRKRRRSSTEPPSEAGSLHTDKSRKIGHRRLRAASEQLQEEEHESSPYPQLGHESRQGSSDQFVSPSLSPSIEVAIPTKSLKERLSLPAKLQVPVGVRVESLRTALSHAKERRARQSTGLAIDNDKLIYVDPSDLDLQPDQLATPGRNFEPLPPFTPVALIPRPTPDTQREDALARHMDTIKELQDELASVTASYRALELGIHSLGVGDAAGDAETRCAALRMELDQLRIEEMQMLPELEIEDMSNWELLQQQPAIMRGLLVQRENLGRRVQELTSRLEFSEAEYEGVLVMLEDRNERNDALELQVRLLDQELDTRTRDLHDEKTKVAELSQEKEEADEQFSNLEKEVDDHIAQIQTLNKLREEDKQQIQEQRKELKDAAEYAENLENKRKEALQEVNKLRAELFGVQQQRDEHAANLENKTAEVDTKTADIEKLVVANDKLDKAMIKLKGEKDTTINDKNATLDKLEATNDQHIQDIKALNVQVKSLITERDGLASIVATRGKDVRALRELNTGLLLQAEQDAAAAREFANRNDQTIADANKVLSQVSTGGDVVLEKTMVTKAVVKKKKAFRDSGVFGHSDTEEESPTDELETCM